MAIDHQNSRSSLQNDEYFLLPQLLLGIRVHIPYSESHLEVDTHCNPPKGFFLPHQIVRSTIPLLHSILTHLNSIYEAKEILLAGLAASLSANARESTFSIHSAVDEPSRQELAAQITAVGQRLVEYARKACHKPTTLCHPIKITSHCEGHLWTHDVASLLTGPHGNSHLMQLYNEWLHRMIILRDILLPLENFEDVPVWIDGGLRSFDKPRKQFLLDTLSGRVKQEALIRLASEITGVSFNSDTYGFQYSHGVIFPASLGGNTLFMLKYRPASLISPKASIAFQYEHRTYEHMKREVDIAEAQSITEWPPGLPSLEAKGLHGRLEPMRATDDSRTTLRLQLETKSDTFASLDLGQIARGLRYAYRPKPTAATDSQHCTDQLLSPSPRPSIVSQNSDSIYYHPLDRILAADGLWYSSKPNEIHLFPSSSSLMTLALLGKLYPENIILAKPAHSIDDIRSSGKTFGGKLVIVQLH